MSRNRVRARTTLLPITVQDESPLTNDVTNSDSRNKVYGMCFFSRLGSGTRDKGR